MWVGQYFPEDNDSDLAWIQHAVYFLTPRGGILPIENVHSSCGYIFHVARRSVSIDSNAQILNAHQWKDLFEKKGFDHKILQYAHHKIAAFYRWIEHGRNRKPVFSGQEISFCTWDTRQIHRINQELALEPMSRYHQYILDSWKNYFVHEMYDITNGEPSISEHIIKAVLFGNTKKGYESEDAIDAFLTLRYGTEFEKICEAWRNRETNNDLQGYVYIMVSPALRQDVIKIGSTTRLPNRRAEEVSIGTGVPVRFFVAFELLVSDCRSIEKIVHERLASNRLSYNREFFDVPLNNAIAVINEVARSFERNNVIKTQRV